VCHKSVHEFFRTQVTAADVAGASVLEVGSRDVNGTVRPILTALGARAYVGVDVSAGPGVDRVCDVGSLAVEFALPFDVVVTTEMLEHVRDWRSAIANLKRVVAPTGLLLLTTRSYGFPYHEFPGDYWRYELDDMRWLFRDFEIVSLVPDPQLPGVFLKARKPAGFREAEISGRMLFSVVKGRPAEPDGWSDEESRVYGDRMMRIVALGAAVAVALQHVDLADAGQRDFRRLWRSVAHLSDLVEAVARAAPSRAASGRWRRRAEAFRREALERLTAARLARGATFGRARQALLESAAGATADNVLRVAWGALPEARLAEIVGAAESIRTLARKIQSYARRRAVEGDGSPAAASSPETRRLSPVGRADESIGDPAGQ
jgi:SAM-dependent methyltransferase